MLSETLKTNQARVQDEKQLGDKLQCVCYIVGNGFIVERLCPPPQYYSW